MDEFVETASNGVWAIIRFVFWHVVVELILFNVGRAFLLACSLGRFPRSRHFPRHENLVGWVGAVVILAAWAALVTFNRTVAGG